MATQVIAGQSAWFGAFDLAAYARSLVLDYGADLQDDTRIADTVRKRVSGVKTCGFSFETVLDSTIESPINAVIGNGQAAGINDVPLTVAPGGTDFGDLAYHVRTRIASYTPIAGSHGDAGKINVAGFGDPLVRGVILYNGIITSTFNGSVYDFGSIPSDRTAYVAVHITSLTGSGTVTYALESDTESAFTAPTTTVTTLAVTGVPAFRIGSGAANERYWRIAATVTGTPSATTVVAFGII